MCLIFYRTLNSHKVRFIPYNPLCKVSGRSSVLNQCLKYEQADSGWTNNIISMNLIFQKKIQRSLMLRLWHTYYWEAIFSLNFPYTILFYGFPTFCLFIYQLSAIYNRHFLHMSNINVYKLSWDIFSALLNTYLWIEILSNMLNQFLSLQKMIKSVHIILWSHQ